MFLLGWEERSSKRIDQSCDKLQDERRGVYERSMESVAECRSYQ